MGNIIEKVKKKYSSDIVRDFNVQPLTSDYSVAFRFVVEEPFRQSLIEFGSNASLYILSTGCEPIQCHTQSREHVNGYTLTHTQLFGFKSATGWYVDLYWRKTRLSSIALADMASVADFDFNDKQNRTCALVRTQCLELDKLLQEYFANAKPITRTIIDFIYIDWKVWM